MFKITFLPITDDDMLMCQGNKEEMRLATCKTECHFISTCFLQPCEILWRSVSKHTRQWEGHSVSNTMKEKTPGVQDYFHVNVQYVPRCQRCH